MLNKNLEINKQQPAAGVQSLTGFKDIDVVINVNRCAKVVKGGRRFSFSALVVSGNRNGMVSIGLGKAIEVSEAVKKATANARKALSRIVINDGLIRHSVEGVWCGSKVFIKPAPKGSGIIAGASVRAVLDAAGVTDAVAKSLGSNNKINVAKATLLALKQLKNIDFNRNSV